MPLSAHRVHFATSTIFHLFPMMMGGGDETTRLDVAAGGGVPIRLCDQWTRELASSCLDLEMLGETVTMLRLKIFSLVCLLFLTACSTKFHVPKVADMPDKSIGSVDYGPREPVK